MNTTLNTDTSVEPTRAELLAQVGISEPQTIRELRAASTALFRWRGRPTDETADCTWEERVTESNRWALARIGLGREFDNAAKAQFKTLVASELADARTWENLAPGRGKPGVGRTITRVSHNPHAWRRSAESGGYDGEHQICNSIFKPDSTDPGWRCPDPVVWKIETRRNHMSYTHYWCDRHFVEDARTIVDDDNEVLPGAPVRPAPAKTRKPAKPSDDQKKPTYFAVADPDNGDMTYWRIDHKGKLTAWPEKDDETGIKVHYGPRLLYAERAPAGHPHVVPTKLTGYNRQDWIDNWYRTVRSPWMASIKATIDADPVKAAADFAQHKSTCFICGRELEDDDSKVYGIGPVCRRRVPEALVQAASREIARAHGVRHNDPEAGSWNWDAPPGAGTPSAGRVLREAGTDAQAVADPIRIAEPTLW